MNGATLEPVTMNAARISKTKTIGMIHQALFCQANSKNSPINRPIYFMTRMDLSKKIFYTDFTRRIKLFPFAPRQKTCIPHVCMVSQFKARSVRGIPSECGRGRFRRAEISIVWKMNGRSLPSHGISISWKKGPEFVSAPPRLNRQLRPPCCSLCRRAGIGPKDEPAGG